MKRILFLLAIGALMIFSLIGCGKESTKPLAGDENDEAFLLAKGDIDSSLSEFDQDVDDGGAWIYFNPMPSLAEPDSMAFDSVNYWHIFSSNRLNRFDSWSRIDSFRFKDESGDSQIYYGDSTNIFERHLHCIYSYLNNEINVSWAKTRDRNVKWEGFTDSILVLTGVVGRNYTGLIESRAFNHTLSGNLDSIRFSTADLLNGMSTHPRSGQMTGTTVHERQLAARLLHIEANYTVTFYLDHYHVHLISGNSYWDWDYYYQD